MNLNSKGHTIPFKNMFNPYSFPAKIGIFAVIDYKKQKNVTNEPATFSLFYNYVTFLDFYRPISSMMRVRPA